MKKKNSWEKRCICFYLNIEDEWLKEIICPAFKKDTKLPSMFWESFQIGDSKYHIDFWISGSERYVFDSEKNIEVELSDILEDLNEDINEKLLLIMDKL